MTAELAGIDPAEIEIEIEGRRLLLSGTRRPAGSQTDVYQQVEIERGPFRRVVELGADVRGQEAKAHLRGRHAADRAAARARAAPSHRSRSAKLGDGRRVIEVGTAERPARDVAVGATRELPREVGVLPLRDTVTFPDMLVPLNIGQPRSVELINDVLRGERTIAMVASRQPEVETPTPRRAVRGRRARRRWRA